LPRRARRGYPRRARLRSDGTASAPDAFFRRLAHARFAWLRRFFSEPDLLLLDEPTNHLDLEPRWWLAEFLRRYRKTLILVSHDPAISSTTWSITFCISPSLKLTLYTGGYETYLRNAGETLSHQAGSRRPSGRPSASICKPSSTGSAPKRAKHVRRKVRVRRWQSSSRFRSPPDEAPIRFVFPDPKELRRR